MSEPRRRVWPIVAVLALLPVLYAASYGPALALALCIADRTGEYPWWNQIYEPVGIALQDQPWLPGPVHYAIRRYPGFCYELIRPDLSIP